MMDDLARTEVGKCLEERGPWKPTESGEDSETMGLKIESKI